MIDTSIHFTHTLPRHALHLALALISACAAWIAAPYDAAAQGDPHSIYEARCAACHEPHAREFAQKSLDLKDGHVLLKGTDTLLSGFLQKHPRRPLSKEDADILDRQLAAMLQSGFLFHEKCIVCHDRAASFARLNLIERDGVLKGRYSDRDIAQFLCDHGRLSDAEAETILAMLRRQLAPH